MWLHKSQHSAFLSAVLHNQRGNTFIHWPRSEPSPCTKLPQYIYSVKGHNSTLFTIPLQWNKPLHSHLASISRWAREGWLGRRHLSPAPARPERVNEFCSCDRAAGCRWMWRDSAGCYRMLWSATGYNRTWWSTRWALVPQMLPWALQDTGRDRMSPLQRQLSSPLGKFLICSWKPSAGAEELGTQACLSLLSVQMPGLLPYTKS